MSGEISNLFTVAVKSGKFGEFKKLVSQIVDRVRKEPGTLVYEYSVSDDKNVVHIFERYSDDNALVSHVEETFSPFAERFLNLVDMKSLVVYGTPAGKAQDILDGFGAVYLAPFDGLTR